MANISAELAAILAAVKGEDVRGSIHDSIDLINRISEVVLSTGTAVTSASSPSGDYFDKSLYFNTNTKELWKCIGTGLGWISLGVLKGDNGNGIASIEKTATSGLIDTYTITYDDDTTSEFYITNGEGNKWYRGSDISGKSTSPAQFTLPYAVRPGDNYINTSSSETEQGAIYHCTQGAEEDEASSWVYDFTLTAGGGSEIDIINALTSTRTDAALSANMGHALKEFIDDLETDKVDKVPDYGLSKNDYSDADKAIVYGVTSALAGKQDSLTSQTAYTSQGDATHVPQITTNSLGQVTGISEVAISLPTVDQSFNSSSTNAQSGVAISGALDGWTQEQTVTTSGSDNVVTFSGLNDNLAYDIYCDAINATAEIKSKTGSGSAVTVVYKVSGDNVVVGTTKCKLRILK